MSLRHCEERSDTAIRAGAFDSGLPRYTRNDDHARNDDQFIPIATCDD